MSMWTSTNKAKGGGFFGARDSLGPLFLTLAPPVVSMVLVHANTVHKGDLGATVTEIMEEPAAFIDSAFAAPSWEGVKVILTYIALELVLMRAAPGFWHQGPVSPSGHRPMYLDNAFQHFCIALVGFIGGAALGFWELSVFMDHYRDIVIFMNGASLVFCLFLYFKGIYAPSTADNSTTGNFFVDYYWGTELYPRILGWDVKQFTNCRFGMMFWTLFPLSAAAYNMKITGGGLSPEMFVNAVLNIAYCAKFFWWEVKGYMHTMDIQHDRAGFYICWGCLVWIPSLYMTHSAFWAHHGGSSGLTWPVALALAALGGAAIVINYEADEQRSHARATKGQGTIWGRKPKMIEAEYTTKDGTVRKSLLLVDGYWAWSRHFHYLPEIAAALLWTVPVQVTHFIPYVYVTFLTILLLDRAWRDDERCANKYGKYWAMYQEAVPYKIVPGLF